MFPLRSIVTIGVETGGQYSRRLENWIPVSNRSERLHGVDAKADVIMAGYGNDIVFDESPASQDVVVGGDGDDDFVDTGIAAGEHSWERATYSDSIHTGPGDDIVIKRSAEHVVDCGAGNDVVYTTTTDHGRFIRNCERIVQM